MNELEKTIIDAIQASATIFLALYAVFALRESWHHLKHEWKHIIKSLKELKILEVAKSIYLVLIAIGPGGFLVCEFLARIHAVGGNA